MNFVMNLKKSVAKKALILLTILILVIPATTGCTTDNKVKDIAERWVEDEIYSVSSQIADWLVDDSPVFQGIAASVISDLIRDNIRWEFSRPKKMDASTYQLIATGRSTVNIPLIGEYTISADFELLIDMNQERVVDSTFDITSVRIIEGRG